MPGENEGADSVEFNLDAAMDSVSSEMDTTVTADEGAAEAAPETEAKPEGEVSSEPEAIAMPKSWARDKEELWKAAPRPLQEHYIAREKQMLDGLEQYKGDAGFARQVREALKPYEGMLAERGIQPLQAVQALMRSQQRLSSGSEAERRAAYEQLGRDFGLTPAQAAAQASADPSQELRERLLRVESALTADHQAKLQRAQSEAAEVVEKFASDPKNEHFEEVAQDMVPFIKAGMKVEDAYERAVWANPVTRAREQAKAQTALETKLRENARLDALKARSATKHNDRGSQSLKAPTETKGKMFDDMHDIVKDMRAREA